MTVDVSSARELVEMVDRLSGKATDKRGVVPVSAVAIMAADRNGDYQASIEQDGASPATVPTARNKALTVIWYNTDTVSLARKVASGEWHSSDVDNARAACPFLCTWDGGIQVMNGETVVAALAVSGRTGLGDRILAVEAAHSLGYSTNFYMNGLSANEVADS